MTAKRIRASEHAIAAAIRAMQREGLAVGELLISGGQVRIVAAGVEPAPPKPENGGPKEW